MLKRILLWLKSCIPKVEMKEPRYNVVWRYATHDLSNLSSGGFISFPLPSLMEISVIWDFQTGLINYSRLILFPFLPPTSVIDPSDFFLQSAIISHSLWTVYFQFSLHPYWFCLLFLGHSVSVAVGFLPLHPQMACIFVSHLMIIETRSFYHCVSVPVVYFQIKLAIGSWHLLDIIRLYSSSIVLFTTIAISSLNHERMRPNQYNIALTLK